MKYINKIISNRGDGDEENKCSDVAEWREIREGLSEEGLLELRLEWWERGSGVICVGRSYLRWGRGEVCEEQRGSWKRLGRGEQGCWGSGEQEAVAVVESKVTLVRVSVDSFLPKLMLGAIVLPCHRPCVQWGMMARPGQGRVGCWAACLVSGWVGSGLAPVEPSLILLQGKQSAGLGAQGFPPHPHGLVITLWCI